MNSLSTNINSLIDFVGSRTKLPAFDDILIFEIDAGASANADILKISKQDLFSVADYEPRFVELQNQKLPWINMSFYGLYKNSLVVGIETNQKSEKRSVHTSINYSGPAAPVIQHGWNVEQILSID